jgi:acid phosphatase
MSRSPIRASILLAATVAAALLVTGSATATAVGSGPARSAAQAGFRPPAPCGSLHRHRADIRHVIVIVFENHSYSDVIGQAPYFTALAHRCGLATNFFAESHPSLPNYIALTSGTTGGLHSDCQPNQCPQHQLSIFGQLVKRHKLWQAFSESMPANCSTGGTQLYAPRHNPAVYYPALRSSCVRHNHRLGSTASGPFHKALRGTLGAFVFVTPNICNDAHSCPLSIADRWLQKWMRAIRSSRVYRAHRTAIVVTFDEGGGNHIATIVVSPYIRAGLQVHRRFDHYSILRASEHALGIRAYLGTAAARGGFGTAFKLR